MFKNVYEGINARNVYEGLNARNIYEGLNARSKVYSPKEYFCEMYPTCVSSKLCKFIQTALHCDLDKHKERC